MSLGELGPAANCSRRVDVDAPAQHKLQDILVSFV